MAGGGECLRTPRPVGPVASCTALGDSARSAVERMREVLRDVRQRASAAILVWRRALHSER
eukprot:4056885-Pleurochrysis_carterae.AAC.2